MVVKHPLQITQESEFVWHYMLTVTTDDGVTRYEGRVVADDMDGAALVVTRDYLPVLLEPKWS